MANVPDTEPRTPSVNRRHLAYQLVDDPESAVTMALCGQPLGQFPHDSHGIGGLGREHALAFECFPPIGDVVLHRGSPRAVVLLLQQRDQCVQGGRRVGDDVQFGGVTHAYR